MYTKPFDIIVNPVGSKFAKALQQALQSKVTNKVFRRLTPKQVKSIISRKGNILRPGYTRQHFKVTTNPLNKVEQFERFKSQQISCPGFATTQEGARALGAKVLFARTLINSTNGRGIMEFGGDSGEYPRAPLYTEYIPKKAEYRFHVFNGEVIDVQEKRKSRRMAPEDRNTRVRNVNNGYVYCRDNLNPPAGAAELAVQAVRACNYEYGAVDIIYNEKRNQCYVLEVNSRPGLMGTTLDKYSEALIKKFQLMRK